MSSKKTATSKNQLSKAEVLQCLRLLEELDLFVLEQFKNKIFNKDQIRY